MIRSRPELREEDGHDHQRADPASVRAAFQGQEGGLTHAQGAFMYELIEDATWEPWEEPIPPELLKRITAEAIRNGRTPSEELNYLILVTMGMIPPTQTH